MSTMVIARASGFIGSYFRRELTDAGWTVRTIGRSGDATWGDAAAMTAVLEGADLLVNLAGKSVSCRYTPANRAEIFRSRVETTAELGRAIAACQVPPRDWFNASTGTIYRDARDRAQTERDGELGTGFSVEVARGWEAALAAAVTPAHKNTAGSTWRTCCGRCFSSTSSQGLQDPSTSLLPSR